MGIKQFCGRDILFKLKATNIVFVFSCFGHKGGERAEGGRGGVLRSTCESCWGMVTETLFEKLER
eukprot:1373927-Karenia_brevis.AAC.1